METIFQKMTAPIEEEIHEFMDKEFPHVHYERIEFSEDNNDEVFEFRVRGLDEKLRDIIIGRATYKLDSTYWDHVKLHFKLVFGTRGEKLKKE